MLPVHRIIVATIGSLLLAVPVFAQATGPVLRVTAIPAQIRTGEQTNFSLTLAGAQGVYGVQTICRADPDVLLGRTATAGNSFDTANRFVIDNGYDSLDGSWLTAMGLRSPAQPFSGDATLFTLNYEAIGAGEAAVSCTVTVVDINGREIVARVENPTVRVESNVPTPVVTVPAPTLAPAGNLRGSATYQNRQPDNAGIQVSLVNPAGSAIASALTSTDGAYTFADIVPGTYSVVADGPSHLAARLDNIRVQASQTITAQVLVLLAGDTDNNQQIDVLDAALIGGNFNNVSPPSPPAADLNNDGRIDIMDLSLLGSNYRASGGIEPVVGPEGAVLLQAMSEPLTRFANRRDGNAPETRRAMAFFTIARALADGNRDAAVIDRYFAHFRSMMLPVNQPDMDGCADARQTQPALAAVALGWLQSDIRARFTAQEQNQIQVLGRAAVVSTAYTNTDGPSRRISLYGDTNCWPRGNPNYTEAMSGYWFVGSVIMGGPAAARSFLNSYSHAQFITELNAAGLTNAANTFSRTAAGTIEGVVRGDRFTLIGVNISQFANNPLAAYQALTQRTFSRSARMGCCPGQLGMVMEFDSIDAGGRRDSLVYSAYAWMHNIVNREVVMAAGQWQSGSNASRELISRLMLVGTTDLLAKDDNYQSYANGAVRLETYTNLTYFGYPYALDAARAMMPLP